MTDNTTQPDSHQNTPTGVLEQLVGPGKKFASVEDLARGKQASDNFVEKLTDETRQLRDAVASQLQEIETLKARASILDRINPQSNSTQQQAPASTPAAGLSADDVVKLIAASKQKEEAERNIRQADTVLIKSLGAEASSFVKQRASELNMDVEDLYKVAMKSPNAFYGMLGINPNGEAASGSMYVANNGTQQGQSKSPVRNKAYYDDVASKMGKTKFYLDKNIQIQLHKDMQTLGDAFFN
jgi:hypothetical protein